MFIVSKLLKRDNVRRRTGGRSGGRSLPEVKNGLDVLVDGAMIHHPQYFPQMYATEHDPPATAEPLKLLQ